MKRSRKIVAAIGVLLLAGLSWPAWMLYQEIRLARSEDPLVWESAIGALEAKSRGRYAPGTAVVFVGSSSIRLWDTLEADMAPLAVLQHGFGGAKLNAVVRYSDRLVSAWQPRAVVVFAGTNDIDTTASKSPETLLASYQQFVRQVRAQQPAVPIFYIGITPSPLRWSVWPIAQSTNALIEAWSDTEPNLYFIDTSVALLGSDGKPDTDNYRFDGLHLNARGYARWTGIIRPRLLAVLGEK